MISCPQDDGFVAKILVPAGSKDISVGTPLAILVEDEGRIAAFSDYSAEATSQAGPSQSGADADAPSPPGLHSLLIADEPVHMNAFAWDAMYHSPQLQSRQERLSRSSLHRGRQTACNDSAPLLGGCCKRVASLKQTSRPQALWASSPQAMCLQQLIEDRNLRPKQSR